MSSDLSPAERARQFLADLPEFDGTPDEALSAANEHAREATGWSEEYWQDLAEGRAYFESEAGGPITPNEAAACRRTTNG